MTARQDIAAAMQAGKAAALNGDPVTACPYDHRSADPAERVHAVLWCRAYDRAQPQPIDYQEGTP